MANEKVTFGSPLTTVTNFTFVYYIIQNFNFQIHDGMSAASPALLNSSSELCSNYNSTEWRFNTSGSFVYIRLRKHFGSRVIILIQRKGLDGGGHVFLTNVYPSGYLKSVNYPEQYPNNIECEWIINAPGLQRVQIDLKDFDIPWNERYENFCFIRTFNLLTQNEGTCGIF